MGEKQGAREAASPVTVALVSDEEVAASLRAITERLARKSGAVL